jgi:flagellar motor switch protein FliN/FliY
MPMADQDGTAQPPPGSPDEALHQAQAAINDISREAEAAAGSGARSATEFELPAFPDRALGGSTETIDLLSDVSLSVKIELGRTSMFLEDVLKLGEGAVVELDKLAGDPVDIYVNNRPVARGEVLVMNDNFCVRVHEILSDSGSFRSSAPRRAK